MVDRRLAKMALHYHQTECDALKLFRPLNHENRENSQEAFFECMATQIVLGGSNQGGKTTSNVARLAAFAMDRPVTFRDGRQIHMRKPFHRGKPVLIWLVGLQLNHIGATLYPKLFLPGAFKLIRDEHTKVARAYDPTREYDAAYKEKAFPAPPLIPESELASPIAWRRRGLQEFECATLKNGAVIRAYASTADVKQGDQVHLLNIDETIDNDRHYNEWMARIGPVEGQIIWSTWFNTDPSPALERLLDLCERDKDKPNPRGVCFRLLQRENPFYPKKMIEELSSTGQWDDDEQQARVEGVWNGNKRRMYPNFSCRIHTLMTFTPEADDLVQKAVINAGQIPPDWTRYLILDPGTTHPAVLFVAVPPPDLGEAIVPYDELYPGRVDGAEELARMILAKVKGQFFEAFVIDSHAGRQTPMGFGLTVEENYRRAFEKYKLSNRRKGSGFLWGSDQPLARIGQVQEWLTIQPTSRPLLRIWQERCPNLIKQLESYRKKLDTRTKKPTEHPDDHQHIDMAVALEYCALINPRYVPRRDFRTDNSVEALFKNEFGVNPNGDRQTVHCGPGVA